ncbi:MAG: HDOD domain-containing protein [Phycisphaerales bacterium]|nr:MAG: HDOD domain-containing protein [Phycisphaerales bacterium]
MAPTTTVEPTSTQRVEVVLSQLQQLPSLSAIATRLLQLTTDSQADVREVIRLIEADPPLVAKVLSMIRRADVGAGGEVRSVEKAVLLLGMHAIRNLVLAVEVLSTFPGDELADSEEPAFRRSEFWKHCLAVGCAAELLADYYRPRVNPHEAFVCGLLHDLGKIALHAVMPKSYDRVIRAAVSRRTSLADVERSIIGVDHMVAGKRLARQWQLPESITACLWLHHHPPAALPDTVDHADLIRVVYLADLIGREMRIGQSGNHLRVESSADVAASIGIDQRNHARVLKDLVGRIEQRAELINVQDLSGEGLYLEALAQANRELVSLNESLVGQNRELESRSRMLEAVSDFSKCLSPGDPLTKVCQKAAGALREVLSAEAVVVCSQPDSAGIYHLGLSRLDSESSESHVLESAKTWSGRGERAKNVSTSVEPLPPHRPLDRECFVRMRDMLGGTPTSMTTITYARQVVGMVFTQAAQGGEQAMAAGVQESAPLVSAIGVALSNARTHAAAEHLAEDLSEANRRLYESQRLLLRQQTLTMISEMAGGAAHELNNPLAVISGRAQLLSADTPPEKVESVAKIITEQAHRCSNIVMELLQFAQPPMPQSALHSVADILNEVRDDIVRCSPLTPESFVLELSDPAMEAHADRDQITCAINELLNNALGAMTERPPRLHVNCHYDPADEQVVIAMSDNGRGMAPDVLERAFDPFYSDRPAGRGRGLGLCHAYRMVEINHGQLRLESTPGKGTTAIVTLPAKPASDTPS